jgi:hypothetical protein
MMDPPRVPVKVPRHRHGDQHGRRRHHDRDRRGAGDAGLLPSGVQYAIRVCNGSSLGIKTTDSKLHDHEFDKVDFYDLP